MIHEGDSHAKRSSGAVATGEFVATQSAKSHRAACEVIAAEIAATAQDTLVSRGESAYTDRAISIRLGISHTAVARFFDKASGVAITIRDTLAAGDSLAEEVALAILAYVHGKRAAAVLTRDSLDRIAIELGVAIAAYHHDIADGREDEHHRHAAHLRKIAGIALRGAAACARRGGR